MGGVTIPYISIVPRLEDICTNVNFLWQHRRCVTFRVRDDNWKVSILSKFDDLLFMLSLLSERFRFQLEDEKCTTELAVYVVSHDSASIRSGGFAEIAFTPEALECPTFCRTAFINAAPLLADIWTLFSFRFIQRRYLQKGAALFAIAASPNCLLHHSASHQALTKISRIYPKQS